MDVKRCPIIEQFQDTWRVIFTVAVIVIALAVVHFFFKKSGASTGLLIGLITGIAVHWMKYAKSSIQINNMLLPQAKSWIERHGYVLSRNKNEFIPDIHWLLRFKSQNFIFESIDNSNVKITCTYSILRRLVKSFV